MTIRTEDTGHVSKLCVKTLFISENFHFYFCSFLCIVRNCNILHSQDVVLGHFGKTGVYAGHCFIIHLLGDGYSSCPLVRVSEPIKLLEIPTSPILLMPNTSYAMLSLGIPWNMPHVTCIFRIHTHL